MTRWEYAEVGWSSVRSHVRFTSQTEALPLGKADFYTALRRLGEEGWEMVGVMCDPEGNYYYYFKRPLHG